MAEIPLTPPQDSSRPRIALGADHAGFPLKEKLKQFLQQDGYPCQDLGTWSEESVDYPDFARAVGESVAAGESNLGVLVCGTGIGMSIAANKVAGIRAAVVHDVTTAQLAHEHNDANVVTMGGRLLADAEAWEVLQAFLAARFAGGRHQRRIDEIAAMDAERTG
jgi:ribose 5-phosphate isomerase B